MEFVRCNNHLITNDKGSALEYLQILFEGAVVDFTVEEGDCSLDFYSDLKTSQVKENTTYG